MTGKNKAASVLAAHEAAGDGLAVRDGLHGQGHYNTTARAAQAPVQSTRTIDRLRREADHAKATGDYAAFCEARRAFLLAQAEAYMAKRAA